MEVNEIAALQDFDKIQLSKIIEKVFIYEPGRMEIILEEYFHAA